MTHQSSHCVATDEEPVCLLNLGYKNTKKQIAKQKKCAKISLFTSILLISQSQNQQLIVKIIWK